MLSGSRKILGIQSSHGSSHKTASNDKMNHFLWYIRVLRGISSLLDYTSYYTTRIPVVYGDLFKDHFLRSSTLQVEESL